MSAAKRRIKRKIAQLVLPLVLLAGCNKPMPDQCMRREIFKQCMTALPAGPVSTRYNDWDEVVKECESTAYYQALRQQEQIKPECRP